ncbi:MAG: AMP-binding protein, partial [bacterium]|nr:AMP-binding protein [bacterium]
MQGVLFNVDTPLHDMEIMTEEEKLRILYEFSGKKTEHPPGKTIRQQFEEQVEKNPENAALTGPALELKPKRPAPEQPAGPGNDKYETLTYRELNAKANRLAHQLIEKGVKPNTITGLMVEPSLEMIVGILAILKAGGAYLPLDLTYPPSRIEYMLLDSNARIILTQDENIFTAVGKKIFEQELIDITTP